MADIGWAGVDLFFVLSAFLITRILLQSKCSDFSFLNFALRRLLRIIPLAYLALLTALFLLPATGLQDPPLDVAHQISFWLFINNLFDQTVAAQRIVPLSHFWSLALEVQFYLLWPIAVYYLDTNRLKLLLATLLASALLLRALAVAANLDPEVTFFWTPMRMDALLAGALAAIWHVGADRESPPTLWTGIGVAVLCLIVFCLTWFDFAGYVFKTNDVRYAPLIKIITPSLLSALFAGLVLLTLRTTLLAAIFSMTAFRTLGKYSYGIYIVHYMLYPTFLSLFGPEVISRITSNHDLQVYIFFVVASFISVLIAVALYHLYEIHFLKLKQLLPMIESTSPRSGSQ